MSRKERIILFILACLNFTHILDFMVMMPLGNFLMPHFAISAGYFSVIVAAYPVSAFFSGLVAAFYVDRFDRKKVLLFAYCGFLVGTFCCGIAPDAGFLMAARIATGLFGGLISAQVLSIIADVFPYEKRGRAMGAVFMAFSVASIFGIPFSLYLAALVSWHAPFIFIGGLGLILVPLIYKYFPPIRGHLSEIAAPRQSIGRVLHEVFSNRAQVLALFLTGILMLGHFMIIPFINPYLEFNLGFSKEQTPLIYMAGGTATLLSSVYIGRMADKYGKLRIFIISLVLSIIPVFLITNLPVVPFFYVLILFGFWFMVSTGRNIPAQAMISTVVKSSERGRFMSFNSSFQQLFTGAASLISGMIVTQDADGKILRYNWVGYLSVAIVLSTIFIARKLARQQDLH